MRTKTLEQNTAQDFAGLQIDQLSKLRNGNITFEQVKWFNNLTFERREALMAILKLVSGDETLMVDALDGKETLVTAKEIFLAGIDNYYLKKESFNKASIATKEQAVDVYKLIQNATFAQMFGFLGNDLNKFCLTQSQIKNFCKKHPQQLEGKGRGCFLFLFKVKNQFFVAVVVCLGSPGLRASVHRFEDGFVWDNVEDRAYVVVPKMTA